MENTEDTELTENTDEPNELATGSPPVELLYERVTGAIRQTAYEVHAYFGHGFLEKVYENALANRLRKSGLGVVSQRNMDVFDADGTLVGHYIADLVVEDCVIIEVKACAELRVEHKVQLLNYLKATGMRVGLLLNFGATQLQIKRVIN